MKDQQIQTEVTDKKSQDMEAGSMEKQQGVMKLHSKAAMSFSDYSKGDGCTFKVPGISSKIGPLTALSKCHQCESAKRSYRACSTSPKYSCCVLFAVPATVHRRRVLLLTKKSQGVVVVICYRLDHLMPLWCGTFLLLKNL